MPRPGMARQRLLLLVASLSLTAFLPYAWHTPMKPSLGDLDWGQTAQLPEEPFVEISDGSDSEAHASVVAILSQHCFQCHGPDPATRKAGLRLDTFEGTRAQTRQGAVVIPGDPEHSRLLVRIDDADAPMPVCGCRVSRPRSSPLRTMARRTACGG